MQQDEELFAFLDDVLHVVPARANTDCLRCTRTSFTAEGRDRVAHGENTCVERCGSPSGELGKDLGTDVWNPQGIKILGHASWFSKVYPGGVRRRLQQEREMREAIPWVPDLQCAWQVLLQCAGPRCHHLLRTLAPESSQNNAVKHDDGMFETMETLLQWPLGRRASSTRWLATLQRFQCGWGGLGLRATRTAPGAFWASWADALHMIDKRLPALWRIVVRELSEVDPPGCLGALVNASDVLDRSSFVARPTWEELRSGARLPLPLERAEPGEYHAFSSSELHFGETLVHAQSCPADQAHLRSHSGPT